MAIDAAIGQLVNEAITADQVVDIYKLAGVDTPELSIFSDEAFYDAIVQNDSAVLEMGDDTLKTIARELVKAVRSGVTTDCRLKSWR